MLPVSTLDDSASLPTPRTSLVGRAGEMAAVRSLLLDDAVPLVTLTGPGGVGKTRLALAAGHEMTGAFADGVVFVDLAPLADHNLVIPTIAGIFGVRAAGDRPLVDQVAMVLRPRQLLLLLDNCEHVLGAVSAIAQLLARCPALQVLATSRSRLRIRGERVLVVPPLGLPAVVSSPDPTVLAETEAVTLLVQRVLAVTPGFSLTAQNAGAVAGICVRLDGLPLALELAAARLQLLSPEALLTMLSHQLRVLSAGERDLPARQRTLRDTIAWSYQLLGADEQMLFRRLAVFAGWFELEAAGVIGRRGAHLLDSLAALVDQSLVRSEVRADGRVRFGMLETIREFASEKLRELGEEDATRRAHAAYFLDLAERMEATMFGPAMRSCLDRMEEAWADLDAALRFFAGSRDIFGELRLAGMMSEYWLYRGHLPEGIERLKHALAGGRDAPPGPLARAHSELAILCVVAGDAGCALEHSAMSLPLARSVGNADRLMQVLFIRAQALGRLAGEWDAAIGLLEEACALSAGRETPDRVLTYLPQQLGVSLVHAGKRRQGMALLEETLAIQRATGQQMPAGSLLVRLGLMDQEIGEGARAAARYGEGLGLLREVGIVGHFNDAIVGIAGLAADDRHHEAAARLLGIFQTLYQHTGIPLDWQRRPIHERAERLARTTLGAETFTAACAAGRGLPLPEALDEAVAVAAALVTGAPPPTPVRAASDLATATPANLSRREREVLGLFVQRQTDREIAAALFISPRTVMTHATSIFTKLGVANRREAAAVAVRHGLA